MSKVKGYTVPFLLVVAVLGIWELVARTVFAGKFLVPPPESVVWEIWQDRGIYQASVPTTVHEAAIGFSSATSLPSCVRCCSCSSRSPRSCSCASRS